MSEQPFKHYIDFPKFNEEISSLYVLISGWIVAEKDNIISSPTINSSDTYAQPLTIIKRPDVEAAFLNHDVLAFHQYLSIFDLPEEECWSIQFFINGDNYSFPLEFKISREVVESFLQQKKNKLQKLREILRCPVCESKQILNLDNLLQCCECGAKFKANQSNYNFLTQGIINYGDIKPTINVSAHDYDAIALKFIEQFKSGIILDDGCGLRNIYYDNVINFEIVEYPTTDILGIGERLPFKSDVFDAVFSLSVLEHVRNPFECAKEIARVLKPGGIVYAVVPFLTPFHGFPDHYYNMTSSGLKNLFSEKFQVIECTVPVAGLPICTLSWFLNSYLRGLPQPVAEEFKKMKVSELVNDPLEYLYKDFVTQMSPETNDELACVNSLIARKIESNFQPSSLKQEYLPSPTPSVEMEHSQSQIQEMEQLQSQLQYNQTELQQAQARITAMENNQTELQQAQARITAMETSKFWKLRTKMG